MTEAWIDVGGTFTDCFVRDEEGRTSRCKVLSSGLVPIQAHIVDGAEQSGNKLWLESLELAEAVNGFWKGAELCVYATDGTRLDDYKILDSTKFRIQIEATDRKLFSQDYRYEIRSGCEAPVLAVRRLTQTPLSKPLNDLHVRLGTTRGTNALLTRTGAKTLLLTTAPFTDLLEIGDQTRPDLFAIAIKKPLALAERTIGVIGRLEANGRELFGVDEDHCRQQLQQAKADGFESIAVCLIHSYLNPAHELQIAELARKVGFEQISVSSQLAPVIELVARAQTTVVDAYLSPIIRDYLKRLADQFGGPEGVRLQVMTSAGGLVDWRSYSGKDCILSGPAGGVVALQGISKATRAIGRQEKSFDTDQSSHAIIGLDMGGTSTDVCRVTEKTELQYESSKAGVRILTPTLPIETVAAGGGSICWFDGVSFRVGPASAGAFPGPACYGRGGPLTITDVNVFLGRIPVEQFPFPIDGCAIEIRLDELLKEIHHAYPSMTREEVASAFRKLANEQMAEAVRTISISQGADPRDHTLVGFGGAAGQHICEIAELLGVTSIFDHADAGLLSAFGMGLAPHRHDAVIPIYSILDHCDWAAMQQAAAQESKRLRLELGNHSRIENVDFDRIKIETALELRYAGTEASIAVLLATDAAGENLMLPKLIADLRTSFEAAHHQKFGYSRPEHAIEVVAVRVSASANSTAVLPIEHYLGTFPDDSPKEIDPDLTPGMKYIFYKRDQLTPGVAVEGPCIIGNSGSTLVIEIGWSASVLSEGTLWLKRRYVEHASMDRLASNKDYGSGPNEMVFTHDIGFDPIKRDCFGHRLQAIATQMGVVLQQTAVSVNVKRRRDYSCAVFDADGNLLANAPHVPVHLGAMGETVRSVMRRFPAMNAGDCYVTNDPYQGGSHLPDVTVVSPVFFLDCSRPAMFVANRAHHADIGGVSPGSMSIAATKLGEEGVVIEPQMLTCRGSDLSAELRAVLSNAMYPPRNIDENMADLRAQHAANLRGISLLQEFTDQFGASDMATYASHLLEAARHRVENFLAVHFSGEKRFEDYMDDGTRLAVSLTFQKLTTRNCLVVDFMGTGPVSSGNLNANRSIVTAALMYVLRCLVADEMPMNEGVMRCVDLRIPFGILNPQPHAISGDSPAVAAGNVETSQRVVDVLLGAFGVVAASQGTMNNLLFGNKNFGFYETICGGSGASEGHHGASAVHTHMTNTRLTDPEVLESRYPVRLEQFSVRRGSGGAGKWRGGDGVIRAIRFLEPMAMSLLTSRRSRWLPFGISGGNAGAAGENILVRADGRQESLPSSCQIEVAEGDMIEIRTPGGGGFG